MTIQLFKLLVDLARALLGELDHPRPADALAGQVGEQIGLGVADQSDDRGAFVAERALALQEPRRCPREHVVGGVLDQRAPDVRVDVADVDVRRAGAVRGRARPRATRRAWSMSATTSTSCPGCTFAPTRTTSSA